MAMSSDNMANEVVNAIYEGLSGTGVSDAKTKALGIWKKACGAIVSHIQKNIEIKITIPSGSVIIAVGGMGTGTANPADIALTQQSVS